MKHNNKFLSILAFGTLCVGLLGVTAAAQAVDAIQTTPVTQGMPQTIPSTTPVAMEKCFGVAKTGQNDCDTSMNPATCDKSVMDADPNYWIYVPQGLCNRLVGGMTTPGASSNTMNTMPTTTTPAPNTGMAPSTLPGSTPSTTQ